MKVNWQETKNFEFDGQNEPDQRTREPEDFKHCLRWIGFEDNLSLKIFVGPIAQLGQARLKALAIWRDGMNQNTHQNTWKGYDFQNKISLSRIAL